MNKDNDIYTAVFFIYVMILCEIFLQTSIFSSRLPSFSLFILLLHSTTHHSRASQQQSPGKTDALSIHSIITFHWQLFARWLFSCLSLFICRPSTLLLCSLRFRHRPQDKTHPVTSSCLLLQWEKSQWLTCHMLLACFRFYSWTCAAGKTKVKGALVKK